MQISALPPDDIAPIPTSCDRELLLQLEETARKQFFASCDRITKTLLSRCQWLLVTNRDIPKLSIVCPNSEIYWRIVENLENIGSYLQRVTSNSRIEVISEDKKHFSFEIEIGE